MSISAVGHMTGALWNGWRWISTSAHVSKISARRICFKATEAEAVLYDDARQCYGCGVPNQVSWWILMSGYPLGLTCICPAVLITCLERNFPAFLLFCPRPRLHAPWHTHTPRPVCHKFRALEKCLSGTMPLTRPVNGTPGAICHTATRPRTWCTGTAYPILELWGTCYRKITRFFTTPTRAIRPTCIMAA